LQIRFCGVRGSIPTPGVEFVRYGGHTSCLAIAHDGAATPTLLLDAGTGLRGVSGLLAGAPFAGAILLSHLHWDHIFGLPFFAAGDRPDSHVAVLLPEQDSGKDATSLLAGVMAPPYFPIEPTQLRGSWTFTALAPGRLQIEGFEVLALELPHKGGRTFGYRISDGHSTLTYAPDHSPTSLGPGEHGFGEYHPAALELARDADVLVHDAQLFPEEFATEGTFGHSIADYSVGLAKRAGVRSLVLFHHRPDRTDDALDGLARRLGGGSAPAVSVAAEGTVLQL
jgi:phosphoribosyl 1,2-cyclic phosphodiesterase